MTEGSQETLDYLAGGWRIFQLRRGHRYATDDVLTAYTACQALPQALRLLDLGAGVGSVGLMTLLLLRPQARLTAVEIQAASAALARKTVGLNGLEGRVEVVQQDLRAVRCQSPFDLITANPPYLPPENATPSPHPQRATARLELNGNIFDYCKAAARLLAPEGRFCFCHLAADARPLPAIQEAGLVLLARRGVIFREGRAPTIALFTCGWAGRRQDPADLVIRLSNGERSEEYRAIRRLMSIEA